jgi:hypothetical protein
MCLPPRTGAFLITPLEGDSHGTQALLITVSIPAAPIKISRAHEIMARMNNGALFGAHEPSFDWKDGDCPDLA